MKAIKALEKKGEIPEIMDLQEELGIPQTGEIDNLTIQTLDYYIQKTGFDNSKYVEDCIMGVHPEDVMDAIREKAIKVILKERYDCELEKIHKFMKDCYDEKVKESGIQVIEIPYDPEYKDAEIFKNLREKGGRVRTLQSGNQVMTNTPENVKINVSDFIAYVSNKDPRLARKLGKAKELMNNADGTIEILPNGNIKAYTKEGQPIQLSRMVGSNAIDDVGNFLGRRGQTGSLTGKGYNRVRKVFQNLDKDDLVSHAKSLEYNQPEVEEPTEGECPDKQVKHEGRYYTVDCKGRNKNVNYSEENNECFNNEGVVVNCITGLPEGAGVNNSEPAVETPQQPETKSGRGDGTGRRCPDDLKNVIAFQQWMANNHPGELGKYGPKGDGVDGKCGVLTNAAWEKYKNQFLNQGDGDPEGGDEISKDEKLAFIKSEMERKGLRFKPEHYSTDELINRTYSALKQGADKLAGDDDTTQDDTTESKSFRQTVEDLPFFQRLALNMGRGAVTSPIGGALLGAAATPSDTAASAITAATSFVPGIGLPLAGALEVARMTGKEMLYGDEYSPEELGNDVTTALMTVMGASAAKALFKGVNITSLLRKNSTLRKQIADLLKKKDFLGIKKVVQEFQQKGKNIFKRKTKSSSSSNTSTSSSSNTSSSNSTGTSEFTDRQYNKYEEFYEKFTKQYGLSKKEAADKAMEQMERLINSGFRKQGGNLFIRMRSRGGALMPGKYIKAQAGLNLNQLNSTLSSLSNLRPSSFEPINKRYGQMTGPDSEMSSSTIVAQNPNLGLQLKKQPIGLTPSEEELEEIKKRQLATITNISPSNTSNDLSGEQERTDEQQGFSGSGGLSGEQEMDGEQIGFGSGTREKNTTRGGKPMALHASKDVANDLFQRFNVKPIRIDRPFIESPIMSPTVLAPEPVKSAVNLGTLSSDPMINAQMRLAQSAQNRAITAQQNREQAANVQTAINTTNAQIAQQDVDRQKHEAANKVLQGELDLKEQERRKTIENRIFAGALNAATFSDPRDVAEHETVLQQLNQAQMYDIAEEYNNEYQKLVAKYTEQSAAYDARMQEGTQTEADIEAYNRLKADFAREVAELREKYKPNNVGMVRANIVQPHLRNINPVAREEVYPTLKKGGSLSVKERKEIALFKEKIRQQTAERKRKMKQLDRQREIAIREINRNTRELDKRDLKLHLEVNKQINKILDKYLK